VEVDNLGTRSTGQGNGQIRTPLVRRGDGEDTIGFHHATSEITTVCDSSRSRIITTDRSLVHAIAARVNAVFLKQLELEKLGLLTDTTDICTRITSARAKAKTLALHLIIFLWLNTLVLTLVFLLAVHDSFVGFAGANTLFAFTYWGVGARDRNKTVRAHALGLLHWAGVKIFNGDQVTFTVNAGITLFGIRRRWHCVGRAFTFWGVGARDRNKTIWAHALGLLHWAGVKIFNGDQVTFTVNAGITLCGIIRRWHCIGRAFALIVTIRLQISGATTIIFVFWATVTNRNRFTRARKAFIFAKETALRIINCTLWAFTFVSRARDRHLLPTANTILFNVHWATAHC